MIFLFYHSIVQQHRLIAEDSFFTFSTSFSNFFSFFGFWKIKKNTKGIFWFTFLCCGSKSCDSLEQSLEKFILIHFKISYRNIITCSKTILIQFWSNGSFRTWRDFEMDQSDLPSHSFKDFSYFRIMPKWIKNINRLN